MLKNTYKKKHRPNNSKSVAIGSKTQTMLVMTTSSSQQQKQEVPIAVVEVEELKVEPPPKAMLQEEPCHSADDKTSLLEAIEGERHFHTVGDEEEESKGGRLTLVCSEESSDHEKRILEYEHKIATSIAKLNNELKPVSPNTRTPKHAEHMMRRSDGGSARKDQGKFSYAEVVRWL